MLDLKNLHTRKRAVSSVVVLLIMIGLTVPAAVITHFTILPMLADGTDAGDVDLSRINELANVISGSAIDINVKNSGEDKITISATKIRCANGTEFPCSSWRTPWEPADGIVAAGKARIFTFVSDHHPDAYGPGMLQLVITFYVGDDAGDTFDKTIAITGETDAGDVELSRINELANVISGSAIDINVKNSGEDKITISATKIKCANDTEFPCSSWKTPWEPADGIVAAGKARIFTFVSDHHPDAYGPGMLQLVITFYVGDDAGDTFDKTIVIAS